MEEAKENVEGGGGWIGDGGGWEGRRYKMAENEGL